MRVSWSGHPQLIKKRVNSSQKGGGHGCYILVTSSYTWWQWRSHVGARGGNCPPSPDSFLLSVFNKENSMADGIEKRVGLSGSYIFYTCAVRDFTCIGVWLRLFFKVFFVLKYIKIIFFIFKKLFLRSAH